MITKLNNNASFRKNEIIVATTPVSMDANDTYLNKYSVKINVRIIAKNKKGLTPKIIPPEVATALPPLKRAKIG